MFDYGEDAKLTESETKKFSDELSSLCETAIEMEKEIEEEEKILKEKRKNLQNLKNKQIPELMEQLGLAKCSTTSGLQVQLKDDVKLSLPKEDVEKRSRAIEWLRKNGHSDIVKHELILTFNRGEVDQRFLEIVRKAIAAGLARNFFDKSPSMISKSDVHSQTLKAMARERLREGKDVPKDLFGTFVFKTVSIKDSKK